MNKSQERNHSHHFDWLNRLSTLLTHLLYISVCRNESVHSQLDTQIDLNFQSLKKIPFNVTHLPYVDSYVNTKSCISMREAKKQFEDGWKKLLDRQVRENWKWIAWNYLCCMIHVLIHKYHHRRSLLCIQKIWNYDWSMLTATFNFSNWMLLYTDTHTHTRKRYSCIYILYSQIDSILKIKSIKCCLWKLFMEL